MRTILILGIAGLAFSAAEAQYRPIQTRQQLTNVVKIARVLQINPGYSSAYTPDGYDGAIQADILAQLRLMGVRLDAVDKSVLAALLLRQPPPAPVVLPPPGPVVAPPTPPLTTRAVPGTTDGPGVLLTKCAACHQAGKLAPDQRFTILDAQGKLVALTDGQKLKMVFRLYYSEMPPIPNIHGITPLTDAEVAAVFGLLR